MDFKNSKALQELADTKDQDALCEAADSCCTNGYDNDGSTGFEIFENGFDLGVEAVGKQVFVLDVNGGDTSIFFIGDEKTIKAKIAALSEKSEEDSEEDEEDSEEDEEEL
jgi:hypothetical protein